MNIKTGYQWKNDKCCYKATADEAAGAFEEIRQNSGKLTPELVVDYHVGCGMFGNIYAGTMAPPRKNGLQMWRNKSDVTSEAVEAVMGHFITEMERDDKSKIQKAWGVRGDKTLKVTFELSTDKKQSDE